jgi:hypothetical protein
MTLPFRLPVPEQGALDLDLHLLTSLFGTGPFTSAQAGAAGVGRKRLQALALGGWVTSQLQRVYRVGGSVIGLEERSRLAAVLLPPGAAVARRSAAWLHGFDARWPGESHAPMELECVFDPASPFVRRAGVRCFRSELRKEDVSWAAGVRVTTPARTAADLLRFVDPPLALAAADAMAAKKLIQPGDVLEVLQRRRGERFVGRAWRLAGWIEARSESFGESWLRLRLLEAGFPRPVAQVAIRGPGGQIVYRIDLGWPSARVGVEYDGEEYHSGAERLEEDRLRRERLQRDFGWHVVGVGRGEVLGTHLDLERGVGELLGRAPAIRRRRW